MALLPHIQALARSTDRGCDRAYGPDFLILSLIRQRRSRSSSAGGLAAIAFVTSGSNFTPSMIPAMFRDKQSIKTVEPRWERRVPTRRYWLALLATRPVLRKWEGEGEGEAPSFVFSC